MFPYKEIRGLESGDELFKSTGHPLELAWIHKSFQEFGSYASAYQIAAMRLIDSALDENLRERDFLVYPIIFLMRHCLELRLKELVQGLNYCIEGDRQFTPRHEVDKLWEEFKEKYRLIGEDIDEEQTKVLDKLIREFHDFDRKSMEFRYPVDKSGNRFNKPEMINLAKLRETFGKMAYFFDCVSDQVSHYMDMAEEMARDSRE